MSALSKMYFMSPKARKEMGLKGRKHVIENYGFEDFGKQWVELVDSIMEKQGSWKDRKNYSCIRFAEVA